MDARTGKQIYSQNADTRLHPASLTKMMTLYMAFTAIERGQVRLDSKFLVSSHAASQPPSRLGLKPGQRIELRYLIRAAAVKSANDAATVIGEGLAGSEPKFAAQMTQMARALGMNNTQFRNANGLTTSGHYSTARDMTTLGRRLFYDFPQYYSIFSRRSADAGIATVSSTNKRFLDSYEGADGIKTGYTRAAGFNLTASLKPGYTRAAGFNLTASAKRGSKRIVATVLGGTSTAHRNAVMAELLDAGFGKAPTRVREVKPAPPQLMVEKKVRRTVQVARIQPETRPAQVQLASSDRPVARASTVAVVTPAAISAAVSRAQANAPAASAAPGDTLSASARPTRKPQTIARVAATRDDTASRPEARPEGDTAETAAALPSSARPTPAPRDDKSASLDAPANPGSPSLFVQVAPAPDESMALLSSPAPEQRSETIILTSLDPENGARPEATEIVTRDGSGGRNWSVSLGLFRSQKEAEQLLLRTALQESASLGSALSRVANTRRGFEANFVGMSQDTAELACNRLVARQQSCTVIGP